MDIYDTLVERLKRFITKKAHNKIPFVSNKDREEVRTTTLRLYNDLTTLPMFFVVSYADQIDSVIFKHMNQIADYILEHKIPISKIYEQFVPPYDKFIIHDGHAFAIVKDFCPENRLKFKAAHFSRVTGCKSLGCQLANIDMTQPHTLAGVATHMTFIDTNMLYPYVSVDKYKRRHGDDNLSAAQGVLNQAISGFNNFIISSVFSHFTGEYTEAKLVKKHTQICVARRANVFRTVSFNIEHVKHIHASISSGKEREGHKLQYQSDMPRMVKFLRHERYSKGGTLPLQYDLEGEPYYYTVEVDPFTRGKDLPRKEDSIKYKVA